MTTILVSAILFIASSMILHSQFARAFVLAFPSAARSSPASSRRRFLQHGMSASATALEVEQKFAIIGRNLEDLKTTIHQEGFELDSSKEMIDWYLDVKGCILTRHDCWLRYRQLGGQETGVWELKRGQQQSHGTDALTVYEETEGTKAVTNACTVLSEAKFSPSKENVVPETFRGQTIPKLPVPNPGFEPFARIVTQRQSWKATAASPWKNLAVDLDTTDFGYAVGEVESVVYQQEEVAEARTQVQALIAKLCNGTSDPAVGKLEYYLQRSRPDIYQACVESGTIRPSMHS